MDAFEEREKIKETHALYWELRVQVVAMHKVANDILRDLNQRRSDIGGFHGGVSDDEEDARLKDKLDREISYLDGETAGYSKVVYAIDRHLKALKLQWSAADMKCAFLEAGGAV